MSVERTSGNFGNNPFHNRVKALAAEGHLVVQPRMGFSDLDSMRSGLIATRRANAATVGTITLDSFTRVGDHQSAAEAISSGAALNGYPLVAYGSATTGEMCRGVHDQHFPIQIRHGSAEPQQIMAALIDAGFRATEGGPVSYCLPYSRLPLADAVSAWSETPSLAADAGVHIETFGGCMLGQLCPPSLLIALSILEGMFFIEHGVTSISLSYAQQTNLNQDIAAVTALRNLAKTIVGDRVEHHTVLYTYMGVYPLTPIGANRLLARSVTLARATGAERLIVKTPAEAHRIPTIDENIAALEFAGRLTPATPIANAATEEEAQQIADEAREIVAAVLDAGAGEGIGAGLIAAFRSGLIDVPFCLHRDNANRARATVGPDGRLVWTDTAAMPIAAAPNATSLRAEQLLTVLNYNQTRFDREQLTGGTHRELSA